MPQRPKIKDLVILVPGVLGSRLLYNGAPLWGDGSPTFLQWVRRRSTDLGRLSVGADDPSLDDLGDGIVPDGVVEGFFVVGRFVAAGGYGPVLKFLQREFSLRLGDSLQVFAYDWRRDLRVAARRLAVKAEGWLQAWRNHSGNREARVILICHAMGGLVGRYYADVEGGWPSVSRIISIGSPFRGSIRALDVLYFGLDFQSYGLPLPDLTPVARTLTSIYQLLPHYPAIRTFAGDVVSPFDIRIPTFEHQKMERARQLHRDLVDRHIRNRSAEGYAAMRSHSIVGIGQPTVELGRLLPNGTLAIDRDAGENELDGDGVVPRFSAEAPAANGFEGHWYYLPQSHGMLFADPLVQSHLRDLLSEPKPGDPPPDTPLPRFTIRRGLEEMPRIEADALALATQRPFYKTGQPVEVRVGARSATGHPFDARSVKVAVRIEQVAAVGRRVRPLTVRMSPDRKRPGWFSGSVRAPAPGTYRVTAAAGHKRLSAFRVSEFFEVDAGK